MKLLFKVILKVCVVIIVMLDNLLYNLFIILPSKTTVTIYSIAYMAMEMKNGKVIVGITDKMHYKHGINYNIYRGCG